MAENRKYTVIDLFAGAGGLSLGLHQFGWHGLLAIERNAFVYLYKRVQGLLLHVLF